MKFKEFIKMAEKIGVGNRCTCYIDDDYIEDAKLQYEGDFWYICQNKSNGFDCKDKCGYKYSFSCEEVDSVKHIRDLNPKKKGIFKGGLEVGDKLVDSDDEYIVMATLDDVVLLGRNRYRDDWLTAGAWYGYDELVGLKFCLFQKETTKKMTKEEIEKELGYKITIV